ncbi:unnamed protein product, partial [Linum tenue]
STHKETLLLQPRLHPLLQAHALKNQQLPTSNLQPCNTSRGVSKARRRRRTNRKRKQSDRRRRRRSREEEEEEPRLKPYIDAYYTTTRMAGEIVYFAVAIWGKHEAWNPSPLS